MIFRSDNYNYKFFDVAFFPWLGLMFLFVVFSDQATFFGKVLSLTLGLPLLIIPIKNFFFNRFEVICEDQVIKVNFLNSDKKNKAFSYYQIVRIAFGRPYRRMKYVKFYFQLDTNKTVSYSVELVDKKDVVSLIQKCKAANPNIKYRVDLNDEDLNRLVKRTVNNS